MNDSAHPLETLETPWWLRPAYIFVILNMVMAGVAWWVSDSLYGLWGAAKYFGAIEFGIVSLAAVSFAVGDYLGKMSKVSLVYSHFSSQLNLAYIAVCVLALVGYAVWIASAVANGLSPDMLVSFIVGEAKMADHVKETFVRIPGITSLTQCGITVACMYPFLRSVSFVERWMFRLLFVLCITRGILYSERLAIIEFVMPLMLAYVARWYTDSTVTQKRQLVFLGPLIAIVSIFLLFAFGEYFRSWQYYQSDYDSFWQFILSRLSAYYVTALNNGALVSQQLGVLPCPFFSILSLWHFPWLPESLSYENFFGRNPEIEYLESLKAYSTEELNNGSGIFIPYIDFGLVGFVLYWIAMAFIARVLFRAYCKSSLVGQLFYPMFLIAIVESPRISYLSNTRVFAAIVASLATLLFVRMRFKQEQ
jgi:oligosaccharide repeat unit polymerase